MPLSGDRVDREGYDQPVHRPALRPTPRVDHPGAGGRPRLGIHVGRSQSGMPVSIMISVAVVLAYLSGKPTQPANFGGYSFTGRFQWPTLPLLVAFAGLYLLELWKVRRLAVGILASAIAAAYSIPDAADPALRARLLQRSSGRPDRLFRVVGWARPLAPSRVHRAHGVAPTHGTSGDWPSWCWRVASRATASRGSSTVPARWNAAGLGWRPRGSPQW